MNGATLIIITIFLIVIILVGSIIGMYSKFVNAKNKVDNQFMEIDKEIKEKNKLVKEITSILPEYSDKYNKINDVRGLGINEKLVLNNKLSSLILEISGKDKKVLEIKEKISDCDSKLEYAKGFFNDSVDKYNDLIDDFPSNIIASIFKFDKIDKFE